MPLLPHQSPRCRKAPLPSTIPCLLMAHSWSSGTSLVCFIIVLSFDAHSNSSRRYAHPRSSVLRLVTFVPHFLPRLPGSFEIGIASSAPSAAKAMQIQVGAVRKALKPLPAKTAAGQNKFLLWPSLHSQHTLLHCVCLCSYASVGQQQGGARIPA